MLYCISTVTERNFGSSPTNRNNVPVKRKSKVVEQMTALDCSDLWCD